MSRAESLPSRLRVWELRDNGKNITKKVVDTNTPMVLRCGHRRNKCCSNPNMIMKTHAKLALATLTVLISASGAFAQGTAFTYQGRLTDNGSVANGSYDL